MSKTFSILEKVSAIRAILAVAKRVQEAQPDATVVDVIEAIDTAVLVKLAKLQAKPFTSLSANQQLALIALRNAKAVKDDVLELLGDAETTRALNPDERDALTSLKAKQAVVRKASAAKRAAEKQAKPEVTAKEKMNDMFAPA